MAVPPASTPSSLPRILCLHGGGTSATIFRFQTRNLARALSSHFRFLYLDGPFPSDAGPGVLPVFVDCGPYFRWMPPENYGSSGVEKGVEKQVQASKEVREQIVDCIQEDEEREMEKNGGVGTVGDVVGVLGFSQGARMAAGLLADQAEGRAGGGMPEWKVGVLLCGSYPPYSLTHAGKKPDEYQGGRDEHGIVESPGKEDVVSGVPTVHVRGLMDPHLEKGRRLGRYFGGEKEVMEFEMGHHLPQAAGDVASGGKSATQEMRDAILKAWRKSGGEAGTN